MVSIHSILTYLKTTVHAMQYKQDIVTASQIKLGKYSTTNRFDDTPDGYYVQLYDPPCKERLHDSDWLLFEDDCSTITSVMTDKEFKNKFEPCHATN